MLDAAPQLRVLANMAVGYDNIDPARGGEARRLGDEHARRARRDHRRHGVRAADGGRTKRRRRATATRAPAAGQTWSPTGFLGRDVFGATLGIVGLGEIGEAMARRARGFDMRVLYASRTRKPEAEARLGCAFVPLDDLLARERLRLAAHAAERGDARADGRAASSR